MKNLVFVLLFAVMSGFAQQKYLTKSGTLSFEASVPSFEEVAANNNAVTAILNTENGEFAALALVKGFRFKNALMEEHFNENYAESDDFPKATFRGKINDFSSNNLNTSSTINGSLTFHGETKDLNDIDVSISEKGGKIVLSGSFKTKASDYKIKIPKVVRNKVTDEVEVSFEFELKKQ